jgi:hypothetical protein
MNVDIFNLLTLASVIILMADDDKIIAWLMWSAVCLRVIYGDIVQYLKGARQKTNDFKDLFAKERNDLEALKRCKV